MPSNPGEDDGFREGLNPSIWLTYPAATPGTVSYTADALNRYTTVGTVSPTYDGNSNLTFDGTFTFGYDAENRLTSAVGAGNTAAYSYDAQGRRKTKTVNGAATVFVTDAGNREVLEYDGASGAIQRWYAYGLGSNEVLNQTNVAAGTRAALIPDIQGSVIASVDSVSGTLSKIGYLPYGKSANAPGTFGYTAQRIDPETNGLYYYRARHYSPAWGRFLQADPIGTQGGVNLYAYVNNDPLNLVDPFGLMRDSPSNGQSLLQGTVNAVPGAYYAGLAQQQFQAGNYGTASVYGAASIADAALGVATLGLSTRVGTRVRAAETALDTTTLFRAVTAPELESIQSLNAFSNPAGIESKYFSTSLEGAQSYASKATSAYGDGPFGFVQTSIPTSSITPQMSVQVDRGIQTVVVPTGQLSGLNSPVILPP
jgi:RHS repeat-associated protein